IKGGIWKNFFIKYHESNYLHKRMLSHSIHQDKLTKSALESLYKLQTNDVFWHGVFGGLYLPNLRDNAYTYLLEIERSHAKKKISYEVGDIDKDGYDELKVLTKALSLVFSSRFGGQMVEFGSLESLFNWQNTLMRREEAYHDKILHPKKVLHVSQENAGDEIATIHSSEEIVDEELKAQLIYDWHPKHSFIDHFSPNSFELERFREATFHEVGDFANQAFELDDKSNTFTREGGIYLDKEYPTALSKQYSFKDDSISLELTCKSDYKRKLYYALEFNFHFAHPDLSTLNGELIGDGLNLSNIDTLEIIDTFTQKKLIVTLSEECDMSAYTLKTVSQSESGFDTVSQQISLIFSTAFYSKLNLNIGLGVSNV
ncbi:MAG: alpha-amylase/4-alpha-glucanotransferase domain-containing protein, partial [Campylobacterota bacterium]|nr:alpha-amylase/4-alpha-glucanotransferase domain-containing protein [Campylobacterota bacterium]